MPLHRESAHEGEDSEVLIDADGNGGNEEQDGGTAATPGSTAGRPPRSSGASYAHIRSLPTQLELSHGQNNTDAAANTDFAFAHRVDMVGRAKGVDITTCNYGVNYIFFVPA
jgi:hypothetical protein